jgi:hypothetical protein
VTASSPSRPSVHRTLGIRAPRSDFPLLQLGFGIGRAASADMEEADKQAILGLNALRHLRRADWFRLAMLGGRAAQAG